MSNAFGSWLTDAKSGTAHYVVGGECLCGARITKSAGPPQRKPIRGTGDAGPFITPLCVECIDLNIARWRGKDRATPIRSQATFWWRQRKTGKR